MVGAGGGEIRCDPTWRQDHQIAFARIGKQPAGAEQIAVMGIELAVFQIGNSEDQAGGILERRAARHCSNRGRRRLCGAGRSAPGARIAADAPARSRFRRGGGLWC